MSEPAIGVIGFLIHSAARTQAHWLDLETGKSGAEGILKKGSFNQQRLS